uniref:Family S33 non-peptidase homologue (S33 family) n=1 Tax=Schistosoma mansoni TaxID=6183 RepID=A0A3Q0KUE1_SCHMA
MSGVEHQVVNTESCGKINVFIQGPRNTKVAFLTVHDLGCNHNEIVNFLAHESMEPLVNRCTWVHVDVPGQGDGESDLPADYTFPSVQQLAEGMSEVCNALRLQYVVVFGEGAGANILVRLVMLRYDIVLGAVLIHCTGTTAGLSENLRDRLIGWKLNTVGMNPAAESYLLMHRFGSAADSEDEVEVREVLIKFRQSLRTAINPRNLNKFIMSFMSRTKILEHVDQIRCPVLFLTGALASHNHTVFRLYNAVLSAVRNDPNLQGKVELIQLDNVANVLSEQPEKVAESLQFFIQGLGLAGGLVSRRMSSTIPVARNRSLSMEEYDQPKGASNCIFHKNRKYSTTTGRLIQDDSPINEQEDQTEA